MVETLGQYRLLEPLGPGTLGDTYRARDTRVGRTVLITVMPDRIASDPTLREQFMQDARAAAAVSHPNIATLYEAGEDHGYLYLAQEFVQGETLKKMIAAGPVNLRGAIDHGIQIAEALADAHASELSHGHITPGAVTITSKGHAKIADFGLARWGTAGAGGLGRAGEAGLAGTSGGTGRAGAEGGDAGYRADLSALGALLFEMVTGRPPAPGAGVPSAINRSLPRELDPIVARALGKSGGYESAATLAAELRAMGAILDVRQEVSEEAVANVRQKPDRSSRKWIAVLVLAGILAALVIAARALGYL
jgi:eukaryotic-like serine/threonine-protein kinase